MSQNYWIWVSYCPGNGLDHFFLLTLVYYLFSLLKILEYKLIKILNDNNKKVEAKTLTNTDTKR